MRNHYISVDGRTLKKTREAFATASESILFSMFQPEELITFGTLLNRYGLYCQQKREDTKGLRTDSKTVEGHLKLLVSKGYVKEIPGDALERLVNAF